ncbi:ribosomal protein L12 [Hamiltosporidium tvaerminnensis]|uniref:Ribosomal protein L12 n=1 Tax=Hamiltosporidium tvaerminnensis TaxID=1176355 RepID=A0A4Q9KR62_9MICR|nr:ribosomal protein L12 [Hamiltosporidium tvaerminnensis]
MAEQKQDDGTKYVAIRCVGGELPGATLAQKVGPHGVQAKVLGEEIKKATAEYKSLKVNVQIAIKDRKATLEVTPNSSTYILKALREPPRDRKKEKNITHHGNITMVDVVDVARKIQHKSNSKEFSGTIKQVLGTCVSIGCRVDGKSPKEVIREINDGSLKVPSK